jgi:Reverse transcriptase (RNA-dependent DNA polymerase)
MCLLNKALYDLKQSPGAWFQTLSNFLISIGFHASRYDPSLFVLHFQGGTIILLVYVDDIIITGTHHALIAHIIQQLQARFVIKDLGSLHYFLSIKVLSNSRDIHLCQQKYVCDLLKRTNMYESKSSPSPIIINNSLFKFEGDPFDEPSLYRTIVGVLQYATITRPDIAFAVNKVA